jgi:hypothetical protein
MSTLHVIADRDYFWPKHLAKANGYELNFVDASKVLGGEDVGNCSPLFWLYCLLDIEYKPGDKVIGLMPSAERTTVFREIDDTDADRLRIIHKTAIEGGSHNNIDQIQYQSALVIKMLREWSKTRDAYFYVFQDQLWNYNGYFQIVKQNTTPKSSHWPSLYFAEEYYDKNVETNVDADRHGLSPMNCWVAKQNNIEYKDYNGTGAVHQYSDLEEGKNLFAIAIANTLSIDFFK